VQKLVTLSNSVAFKIKTLSKEVKGKGKGKGEGEGEGEVHPRTGHESPEKH
jgi:hypothetical protein